MSFYHTLCDLKYEYIAVYQACYSLRYTGRLVRVTPEVITLRVYEEGTGETLCENLIEICTISAVQTGLVLKRAELQYLYDMPDYVDPGLENRKETLCLEY